MTVEMLRAFFGWCTLINFGVMFIALFFMTLLRGWTTRIHAKMFGIPEEEVLKAVYLVMVGYKTAVFLFCFVPYLALRIIA
jgi:hypothetical protein